MKRELNYSPSLVNSLPDKERTVVIYYYTLGLGLKAIANELGIGESRVAQIKAKALKRLELMSQRFYIVIERSEWPDGFYCESRSCRYSNLPLAQRYIAQMRSGFIETAKADGRTIVKDVWTSSYFGDNKDYSLLVDNTGWHFELFIKRIENKEAELI